MNLLWLVPALPLAGFLVLALAGGRLGARGQAVVGAGSVGFSALAAAWVAADFLAGSREPFRQVLWTWFDSGGLAPDLALHLDALALVMILVVTGVGFLIHLYATAYMEGDEGYRRFFAHMDLFVASMLVLVLAGDLLFLYLGWEGVGLCSYLLIGHWYQDPANGRAARKAFLVTRVGDTAFAIGLFALFAGHGTLEIPALLERVEPGALATFAAACLFAGAIGKSAQLPLSTWLPDAMAGPTPTSALIHAATMVTAGVYLIARTWPLYEIAPAVLVGVGAVGAATMLVAAASALVQPDFKRVLAYSTISQLGLMFLALGAGAWAAAIFHLVTHAFFKALLFLGAGAVIHATGQNEVASLGGLRKELPVAYGTFLAGAAALAGFPLVTAGFYSKDRVLAEAWAAGGVHAWFAVAGLVGAFLTAIYAFRLVFAVFHGPLRSAVRHRPGKRFDVPLVVLAALSIGGGFLAVPDFLGAPHAEPGILFEAVAAAIAIAGIALAWRLFLARPRTPEDVLGARLAGFWREGWLLDRVQERAVVGPFVRLAGLSRTDVVDLLYDALEWVAWQGHLGLARTQTGRLRLYAAGLAIGTVLLTGIVLLT